MKQTNKKHTHTQAAPPAGLCHVRRSGNGILSEFLTAWPSGGTRFEDVKGSTFEWVAWGGFLWYLGASRSGKTISLLNLDLL